jgi:hypothetical protein
MATRTYIIVIADTIPKPWPPASQLVALGIPLAVARRYQLVRRDMTAGLKRRLELAKN